MPTHTSMLHIRVDDDIKEQATLALTAMGLPVLRCGAAVFAQSDR